MIQEGPDGKRALPESLLFPDVISVEKWWLVSHIENLFIVPLSQECHIWTNIIILPSNVLSYDQNVEL